jgi:hypothetical protein
MNCYQTGARVIHITTLAAMHSIELSLLFMHLLYHPIHTLHHACIHQFIIYLNDNALELAFDTVWIIF